MTLWDEVCEKTKNDADEFIELLKKGKVGRRKINYPIIEYFTGKDGKKYIMGD